jgi:hypothetical protein
METITATMQKIITYLLDRFESKLGVPETKKRIDGEIPNILERWCVVRILDMTHLPAVHSLPEGN